MLNCLKLVVWKEQDISLMPNLVYLYSFVVFLIFKYLTGTRYLDPDSYSEYSTDLDGH